MSSDLSGDTTTRALTALRTLLATEGQEGQEGVDWENSRVLVSSLWADPAAEVPLLDLARSMDASVEAVPVAEDWQIEKLGFEHKVCRPYHSGFEISLYNIPDLVLLPYDIAAAMFMAVTRGSEGTCVVIWCYWNPSCWLLITAKGLLLSKTASAGTPFAKVRLDRILHALSLPERRKRLGIKEEPALFMFMHHIGHHLWHELAPISSFIAVVAGPVSPPAALANARMVMASLRPDHAPELPIYDPESNDFESCDHLALAYNMIPSMSLRNTLRTADIFFATVEERIRLDPPSFLAGYAHPAPGLRGSKESDSIVFSLRWGNRMLTNTEPFFTALQSLLLAETSIRRIYITGLNSDFGKYAFQKFVPGSPLEQEFGLAQALCELAQQPMQVINLVGSPFMDDLAAAVCSKAVITPWGAALSKYCWALRMPVIFFSNNDLMSGVSRERDIYHQPRYIEEPSFAALVTDVPVVDEPGTMSWLPNSRSNFSIDPDLLARSVVDLLRAIPE
ncbi:MAG: hypothetical protein ACK546_00115 [bacterium]|jgi:hypothetical protein